MRALGKGMCCEMFLGYNTNGLVHHDPVVAIRCLKDIGYQAVGLTIDHYLLSPANPYWQRQLYELRDILDRLEMRCVIETGARFLLDPWRKHEPSLISPTRADRQRRLQFYRHALCCAVTLNADCVSLWSGVCQPGVGEEDAWQWLIEGLKQLADEAASLGVPLGLEPEPGMLIDTTARFDELLQRAPGLGCHLTLDAGHVICQNEGHVADIILSHREFLVNVHLEDMRPGRHEHLMFGEGELNPAEVFTALKQVHYRKGVYVELSRHSHLGLEAAKKAYAILAPLVAQATEV